MIHILSLFVFSFLLSTVEGARVRVRVRVPASSSVSEIFCTTDSCDGGQLAATISLILFVVLTCCGSFRCCPLYDRLQQIAKTIASILFFVLCCCGCCGTCSLEDLQWQENRVQVVMVEGRPYYNITAEEERQRRTENQELRMTETV